jgi:hypothetical protein
MPKKREVGDVHEPVEDTDVPFALKLLVLLMIAVLGLVSAIITIIANSKGLLSQFMQF